jgi:hypothetical protein
MFSGTALSLVFKNLIHLKQKVNTFADLDLILCPESRLRECVVTVCFRNKTNANPGPKMQCFIIILL